MATETENLGLFKYEPVADGKKKFNITQALNNNWDTVDGAIGALASKGGLPPTNCKGLIKEVKDGDVYLSWSDSKDTVIDSFTLCTWAGTVIVKKLGDYPENPNDGEIVIDNKVRDAYASTSLKVENSEDYYFRAFPYSANGIFNLDNRNRFGAIVFGYKLDKLNKSPSGRITGIEANEFYKSAYMDYSSDSFNYGDWKEAFFLKQLRVVMLRANGEVAEVLNPDDYTKTIEGNNSSVAVTSGDLNCMVEFPIIYRKYVDLGNVAYCYISNQKIDEDYHAINFFNNAGVLKDKTYIGAYEGTDIGGKKRCLSGQKLTTTTTTAQEVTTATANGSGWYTRTCSDWQMICDLLILMAGTTDLQTAYGLGNQYRVSQSNATAEYNVNLIANGTMDKKGLFWGHNNTTSHEGVKVFGIENFWGNAWDRVAGYINKNGKIYVKDTWSTVDGSTVVGYNDTANGYKEIGTIGTYSSNYISRRDAIPMSGFFPVEANGSSSTYDCDGIWSNTTQLNYARVGCSCYDGLLVGPLAVILYNAPSYSAWHSGSSLSYKPS